MKLPQFVPILTAFTARVAGREVTELMQSPTALAMALADTQTVVGHDGVLSIFDPSLLSSACIRKQDEMNSAGETRGTGLTPPDEILQTAPMANLLESIQPLRHLLPDRAMIFATFTGPGLLWSQLRETFVSCGMTGAAGFDYVHDVILSVVRSSLELKADGIALIEQAAPGIPSEFQRCRKMVRKLADFYDAGFLAFRLPGTEDPAQAIPAHCVFDLAPPDHFIGPIVGQLEPTAASQTPPVTTAGDVPESTPVEKLKNL
jgi:hypothetical protein